MMCRSRSTNGSSSKNSCKKYCSMCYKETIFKTNGNQYNRINLEREEIIYNICGGCWKRVKTGGPDQSNVAPS